MVGEGGFGKSGVYVEGKRRRVAAVHEALITMERDG
jgi:hypothetical protein